MKEVTRFILGRLYVLKLKGFAPRFFKLEQREGDTLAFTLRQKRNHKEICGNTFIPEGENQEVFAFTWNCRRAFLTASDYIVKGFDMTCEQLMFAKAVWQLFNHRDEILANPRMAYAPIDMHNVLAYAGALEEATLGVYLEWWMKCAGTLHTNERGLPSLMVRFSGSPLTGMNECTMVAWDGAIEKWRSDQFHYIFHMFLEIKRRYKQAKPDVEPYFVEQVISILERKTQKGYLKQMLFKALRRCTGKWCPW